MACLSEMNYNYYKDSEPKKLYKEIPKWHAIKMDITVYQEEDKPYSDLGLEEFVVAYCQIKEDWIVEDIHLKYIYKTNGYIGYTFGLAPNRLKEQLSNKHKNKLIKKIELLFKKEKPWMK